MSYDWRREPIPLDPEFLVQLQIEKRRRPPQSGDVERNKDGDQHMSKATKKSQASAAKESASKEREADARKAKAKSAR